MVPYEKNGGAVELTRSQRRYNYIHSRSRIVVEVTFAWLKNRFQTLETNLYRRGQSQKHNCYDIASCIVFHNMMINAGDSSWCEGAPTDPFVHCKLKEPFDVLSAEAKRERLRARQIRDGFCDAIWTMTEPPAKRSRHS